MSRLVLGWSLAALVCLLLLSSADSARAAGVALCIAYADNSAGNSTDVEYFLRYGGGAETDGYDAERAARQDHRAKYGNQTPGCRNSARGFLSGGYYVIIKGGRTRDYAGASINRWALGYGSSRSAALQDAVEELGRRDWSWSRQRHGYSVEDQGTF